MTSFTSPGLTYNSVDGGNTSASSIHEQTRKVGN